MTRTVEILNELFKSKISKFCPICNYNARENDRFCKSCGNKLMEEIPPNDDQSKKLHLQKRKMGKKTK